MSLLLISILSFVDLNKQLNTMITDMTVNHAWIKDQYFLSNMMHLSYNVSQEPNVTVAMLHHFNYTNNYHITFDPPIDVKMVEIGGTEKVVRLN